MGVPPTPNILKTGGQRGTERGGAGYFLPGVWGCPPAINSPKDGGNRGLKKAFVRSLLNPIDNGILA